jgi:hypothetical protein
MVSFTDVNRFASSPVLGKMSILELVVLTIKWSV